MLDLLAAGKGLGTPPDFLSRPDERAGRLVRVLPDLELAPRFVLAVRASGSRQDARISAFLQSLEAALAIPDPA